mgnify:FL=1
MRERPQFNLDDQAERSAFLERFGTMTGRALANRLGLRGKGSTSVARALSCFAWNAETAAQCRRRGDVAVAQQYEGIADRIYRERLAELGWW